MPRGVVPPTLSPFPGSFLPSFGSSGECLASVSASRPWPAVFGSRGDVFRMEVLTQTSPQGWARSG